MPMAPHITQRARRPAPAAVEGLRASRHTATRHRTTTVVPDLTKTPLAMSLARHQGSVGTKGVARLPRARATNPQVLTTRPITATAATAI